MGIVDKSSPWSIHRSACQRASERNNLRTITDGQTSKKLGAPRLACSQTMDPKNTPLHTLQYDYLMKTLRPEKLAHSMTPSLNLNSGKYPSAEVTPLNLDLVRTPRSSNSCEVILSDRPAED